MCGKARNLALVCFYEGHCTASNGGGKRRAGVSGRRVQTEWKEETRMKGKLERRTMEAAETVPGKPKPATLDYRTSGTLVPEIPETQKSVKVEF